LKIKDNKPREKLVILEIENTNVDASGGEPIFAIDGTPVGRVSTGAYGHSVDASIALGFIETDHVKDGAEFDVAVLGIAHRAKLLSEPPFDPAGALLRS